MMNLKLNVLLRLAALCFVNLLWNTQAQEVPVLLNQPALLKAAVVPGQTSVVFKLDISETDVLQLDVIAPVPGVQLTLTDPSGLVAFAPGDSTVHFLDGSLLNPPLPGGQFHTPAIEKPLSGQWTLSLTFPPATERTVILATSYIKSPYSVGLVVLEGTVRVGQPKPLEVMVLQQGKAVKNLHPVLTITAPSGATEQVDMHNDGDIMKNADMRANDSLYSNIITFKEIGLHHLSAEITIPLNNGQALVRTVTSKVKVKEPRMDVLDIEGEAITGKNNCVESLNVKLTAESYEENHYITSVWFQDGNGTVLRNNRNKDVPAGNFEMTVPFTVKELREEGMVQGPYTIKRMNIISDGELTNGSDMEFDTYDLDVFAGITEADFCYPPIHILPGLNVSETLQDGYIASLDFAMTMKVAQTANYKISFNISDAHGQQIQGYYLKPYLPKGDNILTFSLPASAVQQMDGPFKVQDLLAEGGYETLQHDLVGETASYSHWQFLPTKVGDLDYDGDVDGDDRNLLLTYRNQTALSPGDQRDLNRDGKIDIRDAGLLSRLK